jgi:hypothetical protein
MTFFTVRTPFGLPMSISGTPCFDKMSANYFTSCCYHHSPDHFLCSPGNPYSMF